MRSFSEDNLVKSLEQESRISEHEISQLIHIYVSDADFPRIESSTESTTIGEPNQSKFKRLSVDSFTTAYDVNAEIDRESIYYSEIEDTKKKDNVNNNQIQKYEGGQENGLTNLEIILNIIEKFLDKASCQLEDLNPFANVDKLNDERPELRFIMFCVNFALMSILIVNIGYIYSGAFCLMLLYPTFSGIFSLISYYNRGTGRSLRILSRVIRSFLSILYDYSRKFLQFSYNNLCKTLSHGTKDTLRIQ